MVSTAQLNIVNLQVEAAGQIAIDKANGSYAANLAANDKYYLWQSDFQTLPTSMFGEPELYAERLHDALPGVTTLRIPFNLNSFNADGTLHPDFERFLVAAANEGFTFIMVQMEGAAQTLTASGPNALDQMRDGLSVEVYDRMEQGWTMLLDWMDTHPSVKDSVYAHEVVNEPAAYNTATFYGTSRPAALQDFVSLYATHMVQLGQMIQDRADGTKIMVGGWNYSAQFQQLADISMGGGSALDYIREGLGDSLVWSAHLYPGWLGTGGMSDPNAIRTVLDEIYSSIVDDSLILSETNAQGNEAYNLFSDRPEVQGFTQVYDWFADRGIGISWFTGSQYGGSVLSRMDPDGTLSFVQQGSFGAAMDAFTLGGEDPDHAGGEVVEIQLIRGRMRNQTTDPDYQAYNEMDIAQFLGSGLGHGGNDTLTGSAVANNFLYGGTSNDLVTGNILDDFLYGQDDNDTIDGGLSGHDHLFGGGGEDLIIGGAGISQMYGGTGGDTFVAHPRGQTIIVDYDSTEGDQLIINEADFTVEDVRRLAQSLDWDLDDSRDLRIALPGGGEIIMLGMGDRLEDVIASLFPAQGNVEPAAPAPFHLLLQGRPGVDILAGGAGNDTIYGDPEGAVGADQLYGGANRDLIYGGGEADYIDGGTGNDTLYGGEGGDAIHGGLHNDVLEGGGGDDTVHGSNGQDVLSGGLGSDTLSGDGGRDTLYGGDSSDLLLGGGGNDMIFGGNGNDTLYGGNRNDLLYGDASNDVLYGEKWNDTLYGGAGQDDLYGGTEDDDLYGENSNDTLDGGSGNDMLDGGGQNDLLYGGTGNDDLHGGFGLDTLYGENGDELLNGGGMADMIYGGSGNDTLLGEAGNDWIHGGPGQDVATGGGGADTFVFDLGDGSLRITDFSVNQGDILRLDAALLDGAPSVAALQERATLTDAGTSIIFTDGNTVLIANFQGTFSDSFVDIL
ncbi:calcium-binding protein [Paracoccus sp. JM45]|uniref:calcium-binding protein n=1 Tax=Paracoccus sp. JM45 TaxID=2283626 RepID=UPI000E6C7F82|nr:calcium-binding protein [Paracoccus sp. JM45]RJE78547.1 calcium-binding protein [Paracoccus sp. JM45]